MKKILLLPHLLFFASFIYAQTDTLAKHKKTFSFERLRKIHAVYTDEIGGLFGIAGNAVNKQFFSYQSVTSYQFDPHAYIGAGLALEVSGKKNVLLNEGSSDHSFMFPIYAEARTSFCSKRVSPYFSQKAGYSFYVATPHPSPKIIGGAMIESQIGIKTFIAPTTAFNFSVGYRLQCLAVPVEFGTQFADYSPGLAQNPPKMLEYYHFLSIHAGFTY